MDEFNYLRAHAVEPLAKFLDYITYRSPLCKNTTDQSSFIILFFIFDVHRYSYMIDNVVLLITGTLHERDTKELMQKCHPLGIFETMETLSTASNMSELYNSVLVDTPLGITR